MHSASISTLCGRLQKKVLSLNVAFTFVLAYFNLINWSFFILLLFFVYTFNVFFSMLALLAEANTFDEYKKMSNYFKLIYSILLEPIFFQPFIAYSSIRGDISLLFGKKGWGQMTRKGFEQKNKNVNQSKKESKRRKLSAN